MTISYTLHENHLITDSDDYTARIRLTDSADLETIITRITEHGSNLTEATIRGVCLEVAAACEGLLLEGYRVNLNGICDLFPRISGRFQGASDRFDPSRHRVDVGASPGALLRYDVREKARLHKTEVAKPAPLPLEYVDTASGERNGQVTPGNIGTVNGAGLGFDASKKDEGVFLMAAKQGGKAFRVADPQKNKPRQLVFLNPANLPKGQYRLVVRARARGGLELRTGVLDDLLTV